MVLNVVFKLWLSARWALSFHETWQKIVFDLGIYLSSTYFMIFERIIYSPSPGISKIWSAVFVLFILPEILRSDLILLNKAKIVEIWTKIFISRVILKAERKRTTVRGYFVIINSKILLLKLRWQINAENGIKNQRRISIRQLLLSCFVQSHQSWNSVKYKIYPREYSGSDNFKFKD